MRLRFIAPVALCLAGCAGTDYTTGFGTYTITPTRVTVPQGQSVVIQVTPSDPENQITWSIRESNGGSLTGLGTQVTYRAPNRSGTFRVEARMTNGPTLFSTITVPSE